MSKDMIAWKIHIVLSNINLVNSPPPEGGGLLAKIVKVMKRYTYIIHYDYRGLIEKGLALEAPEGMYE